MFQLKINPYFGLFSLTSSILESVLSLYVILCLQCWLSVIICAQHSALYIMWIQRTMIFFCNWAPHGIVSALVLCLSRASFYSFFCLFVVVSLTFLQEMLTITSCAHGPVHNMPVYWSINDDNNLIPYHILTLVGTRSGQWNSRGVPCRRLWCEPVPSISLIYCTQNHGKPILPEPSPQSGMLCMAHMWNSTQMRILSLRNNKEQTGALIRNLLQINVPPVPAPFLWKCD